MNPFPSFIISEETKLKSKLGEFLFTIKRDYGNNKLQFDRSQVHYEFKVILLLPRTSEVFGEGEKIHGRYRIKSREAQ